MHHVIKPCLSAVLAIQGGSVERCDRLEPFSQPELQESGKEGLITNGWERPSGNPIKSHDIQRLQE